MDLYTLISLFLPTGTLRRHELRLGEEVGEKCLGSSEEPPARTWLPAMCGVVPLAVQRFQPPARCAFP
jgi:hypothetical protein